MAWEISISAEGWNDIYQTLHQLTSKEKLVEALCNCEYNAWEEKPSEDEDGNPLDRGPEPNWDEMKARYGALAHDVLAEEVFEKIGEINTCDNGGNGYWMDPEGYQQLYVKRFCGERLEEEPEEED